MSGDSFLARWLELKARSTSSRPELPPVDVAKLPPVESLTAESDFSLFLQPGVPPDLLRKALYRAWRTDPAILEFVGIAEMQWDFNDPDAMPGFGELEPGNGQDVVQLSTPSLPDLAAATPDVPQDRNPGRDGQLDPVWTAGSAQVDSQQGSLSHPEPQDAGLPAATSDVPRRHGSALPKAPP